jgi:uncharacterized protein YgiM (DUF1202 family)
MRRQRRSRSLPWYAIFGLMIGVRSRRGDGCGCLLLVLFLLAFTVLHWLWFNVVMLPALIWLYLFGGAATWSDAMAVVEVHTAAWSLLSIYWWVTLRALGWATAKMREAHAANPSAPQTRGRRYLWVPAGMVVLGAVLSFAARSLPDPPPMAGRLLPAPPERPSPDGPRTRSSPSNAPADGDTVRATTNCNVRAEPSTEADVVGRLRAGREAPALRRDGDWTRIRTSDGTEGWIHDACQK